MQSPLKRAQARRRAQSLGERRNAVLASLGGRPSGEPLGGCLRAVPHMDVGERREQDAASLAHS